MRRDHNNQCLDDSMMVDTSNARWHGSQSAGASWSGTRKKPSISWVCCNWPVP